MASSPGKPELDAALRLQLDKIAAHGVYRWLDNHEAADLEEYATHLEAIQDKIGTAITVRRDFRAIKSTISRYLNKIEDKKFFLVEIGPLFKKTAKRLGLPE